MAAAAALPRLEILKDVTLCIQVLKHRKPSFKV